MSSAGRSAFYLALLPYLFSISPPTVDTADLRESRCVVRKVAIRFCVPGTRFGGGILADVNGPIQGRHGRDKDDAAALPGAHHAAEMMGKYQRGAR